MAILALAAAPALAGWSAARAAAPADAAGQLRAFVKDVRSASGSFTQVTTGAQGAGGGQQQAGSFAFQRPGKFRWAVEQPYEQLVVSDGQQLYQYDPDLAQVSVRAAEAAIGNAPAQVLFGSGSIDASFKLEPLSARDDLAWLRAVPLTSEAGFSHMDIGFADGLPMRIELLDAFGQTTRIEFTTILPNPDLPAGAFEFAPPPGTDVVRM
ncbi:outer membrane lipoprotein chaperone LolA [Verticiella sediminum]|uniref:Outer-membrane lipoprotein carrier protein n=2 Tax=Verticiella sediminum TaxID=1247510 RepID=A0A556AD14_9BURK|nr:outer membrane lipoprotein chaperone LolA [Verticiella sediminum]